MTRDQPLPTDKPLLTNMELAIRYDISLGTFVSYQRWEGFPRDTAKFRQGAVVYWDVEQVDRWMHARPNHTRQRPARWRDKVAEYVAEWDRQNQAA